jgi:hypothetical protein
VVPGDQSVPLAEFARACKAAARIVSLYPATHPAIRSALSRVTAAASRLTTAGDVRLTVTPDQLAIEGQPSGTEKGRMDPAVNELATLLHERLVGELGVAAGASSDDWHALLLLLARPPDDLIATGGIGAAWSSAGRNAFTIREIDYAEVLRERGSGGSADWDLIVTCCLRGDVAALDERVLAAMFADSGAPDLTAFIRRLEQGPAASGATMTARAAALLTLARAALAASGEAPDRTVHAVAQATSVLSPDMMLALLAHRQSPDPHHAQLATSIVGRINDRSIASFVANSVVAEGGATDRLAYAFQALVPDVERRDPLLDTAHDVARQTPFGSETTFESLWHDARMMLTSYTDAKYVSDEYARELSGVRAQAIEVDRVSDDPPDRVQAWLASVSEGAIKQLDLDLLLDLVRIETGPDEWSAIAAIVVGEIERRTQAGDIGDAQLLTDSLVREAGDNGRPPLRAAATAVIDRLAAGPLVRSIVTHLRRADGPERVQALNRLCQTVGPVLARPLAEALAVEEQSRTIRHLRELLLGFGAAGRQSVEQLKSSSNPAVRRTAIDLLRVFGGREALQELESMLDDSDPQVQRESIRAIVQIGTNDAYAMLEHALMSGGESREMLVQQLIGLRDEKAIPLLCHVLEHTAPRGPLVRVHVEIIEALGGLGAHRDSTRTLRTALFRGEWWAPRRTARLRHAAAAALKRIGTAETRAVLDEAASRGSRGVRQAAQAHVPAADGKARA